MKGMVAVCDSRPTVVCTAAGWRASSSAILEIWPCVMDSFFPDGFWIALNVENTGSYNASPLLNVK
jgi:hypothetical protein